MTPATRPDDDKPGMNISSTARMRPAPIQTGSQLNHGILRLKQQINTPGGSRSRPSL